MIVTWVTQDPVNESVVEYGLGAVIGQVEYGAFELFVDGGFEKREITVHRVQLSNLIPGKTYRMKKKSLK
jgi:hypothetical protein